MPDAALTRWNAHLRLRYAHEHGATRVRERVHVGPLRVLKTLYPEGEAIAHSVIVHPPAGIAARDTLAVECEAGPGAHVVIATPGAQKWYQQGPQSAQETGQAHTQLRVHAGGVLEWLPQESIVFDGCFGEQSIQLDLADGAKCMAWELLQLGRRDSGEPFAQGQFVQSCALRSAGKLVLCERMVLTGHDRWLRDPLGDALFSVVGNVWIVGHPAPKAALSTLQAACVRAKVLCAVTLIESRILLVKAVGHRAEDVRSFFVRCRDLVRESWCGVTSAKLRIWST
jgi:urease accessory protein